MKNLILILFVSLLLGAEDFNINLSKEEKIWIENNRVSIGIEQWKPLIYFEEDSKKIIGLSGDILNLVVERLNLKTKIINDKWDILLNDFQEHKIDLLPATYYTNKRATYGLYSKEYLQIKEYIYVKNSDTMIKHFGDLRGKKIAIIKDYGTIPKIKSKYPSIEIVETRDLDDSINRVLNGEVVALVDVQLSVENYIKDNIVVGLRGVAQDSFKASPIHFFSNTQKPILNQILQKGLDTITPKELEQIISKWLGVANNSTINLTTKERKWLDKNHIVNIRVGDAPPYQINKNGELGGISVDYMKIIFEKYNIRYKLVSSDGYSWKQALKSISDKSGIDILLTAKITDERKKNMLFTDNYVFSPWVIFTRDDFSFVSSLDDLKGKVISIENGFVMQKFLKKDYPSIVLKTTSKVNPTQLALKLLATGKVDAYIGNLTTGSYIIKQEDFYNIKVASPTKYGIHKNAMAVRGDWSPLVCIINRELRTMSNEQKDKIKNRYFNVKYEYGISFSYLLKWILSILMISSITLFIVLKINQHLKRKVKEEVEKNRQQQLLMLQQSRLAQMGEMLSMIAHQWRQPLNSLAMINQTIVIKYIRGSLADKDIEYFNENSNKQIQNMSKTIDDFRDFFKPEKEEFEFYINDVIIDTIDMVKPVFMLNNIEIIFEKKEKMKFIGYANELGQAILNIINNAKDALIENEIKDKQIVISLKMDNENIILIISDNAGGIPVNVIDKIFDPYFSTKEAKNGTGIGLYMTKIIIEEHLNGKITVSNDENGAVFKIELKLNN